MLSQPSGVCIISSWTWVDLCDHLSYGISMEVVLCDLPGWFIKMAVHFPLVLLGHLLLGHRHHAVRKSRQPVERNQAPQCIAFWLGSQPKTSINLWAK